MSKECLECGCISDTDSFKTGCPSCGNGDSWMIKEVPSPSEQEEEGV